MAKRSKSKAAKIRKLLTANINFPVKELAQKFDVNPSVVYNLRAKLKSEQVKKPLGRPRLIKQTVADTIADLKSTVQANPEPKIEPDNVNAPPHYTSGGIETIDYIEAKGLGYHLGNVVKYISRAGKKGTDLGRQDLLKAQWYLTRAIDKNEFQSPTR
jgi:hypothetical protein